jgi:hypothetical protein
MSADIKLNGATNHSGLVVAESQQDTPVETSFAALLKNLSGGIRKEDIKKREGWKDRNGRVHYVDYVEWHVVADLLDKITPNWSHAVRGIVQVGDFVAAIAAITINGVTREGIGTGVADSETGIKKAEHDALKRAAVKFGVARDLYRDEEKGGEPSRRQGSYPPASPPSDPIAKKLSDLITPNQLGLINKLAKRAGLDPESLSQEMYRAHVNEISRRAASALIDHLNAHLQQR